MRFIKKSALRKYLSIFQISLQTEFVYKFNFVMWRARNVLQILLVFFLWDSIFSDPTRVLLGYTRQRILTYVFFTIFVKALVFSARTNEVAGEVAQGDLSNYMLKPVSYFKYWLTRDISSKVLNFVFATIEFLILAIFLKPDLFLQVNLVYILAFVVSIVVAIVIYFSLIFIVSVIPFWMPEAAWGGQFLLITILDFLSGSLFPIDVLPVFWQRILYLTPFPYLIFFPIQIYLGNCDFKFLLTGLSIGVFWAVFLWQFMKFVWRKGFLVYQAFGR